MDIQEGLKVEPPHLWIKRNQLLVAEPGHVGEILPLHFAQKLLRLSSRKE